LLAANCESVRISDPLYHFLLISGNPNPTDVSNL
jgi:hypothetical protein